MMKNPETDLFITVGDLKIYYKIGELECYPPREDSFLLNKHIKYYCKNKKVLDMGCGTGIQGLEAYRYTRKVTFSDIDINCIKLAKINFYINYIKHNSNVRELIKKVDSINFPVEFIVSNLFENISDKFDIILFNPPYLPGKEEDEKLARWVCGGENGKEIIEAFLKYLKYYLNPDGLALLIVSSYNKPRTLIERFSKDYKIEIIDKLDFFFESLYLLKIKKVTSYI